jgi:hypothetical protein
LTKENENRDKENDCYGGNVTYESLDLSCVDANVPYQKSLGSLSNIWNNVLFVNPSNLIFRPPGLINVEVVLGFISRRDAPPGRLYG